VNIGTSTCRLGGYPNLLGIRDGHEYAFEEVSQGTQNTNLKFTKVAPRMSGALILDTSRGCNANVYPYSVSDQYTEVVVLLPHATGHVKVVGVPLYVPCGFGESQLVWAMSFVFN
jgi:hypothetical protein